MKKATMFFAFTFSSLFFIFSQSEAKAAPMVSLEASETAPVKVQEPVKRTAEEEKKLAEKRKKIEERKKEINGSEWKVVLKPQDKKQKEIEDVITFQNDQISSKNLSKRGFSSTNYTISLPDDSDTAVWETMKTGKEGVAFLRGEWNKDMMTGSISERLDEGKTTLEYYFTSAGREGVSPTSTEEASESDVKSEAGPSLKALVSKEEAKSDNKTQDKKKTPLF